MNKYFPDATDEDFEKIEEVIEIAVENVSCEIGYLNEKYYKTGLADGIKLVFECMKMW